MWLLWRTSFCYAVLPPLDQGSLLWNLWKPLDRLWIGYGGLYCDNWNSLSPCSTCTSWHVLSSGQELLINLPVVKFVGTRQLSVAVGPLFRKMCGWAAQWVVARACLLSRIWGLRRQVPRPTVQLAVNVQLSLRHSFERCKSASPCKGLASRNPLFFLLSFLWYYLLLLTRLMVSLCI